MISATSKLVVLRDRSAAGIVRGLTVLTDTTYLQTYAATAAALLK